MTLVHSSRPFVDSSQLRRCRWPNCVRAPLVLDRGAFMRPYPERRVPPRLYLPCCSCGSMFACYASADRSHSQNRLATHAEAVITQLIFNHALRIRMKAEVSDAPSTKDGISSSEAQSGKLKNLTGRVNNLVTSDLASIRVGWDFLYLGMLVCLCFPVKSHLTCRNSCQSSSRILLLYLVSVCDSGLEV